MTTERQAYRAPALDKGLDILELLATRSEGLTRSEIVKELDRSPSEIYRMLERLVEREYVLRSAQGDRFSLSMKTFLLGTAHPPLRRLVDPSLPLMQAFSRDSMQSLHMAVAERGVAIVVAETPSETTWQFRLPPGARLNLLKTSSGQVLLAMQSDEQRHAMLAQAGIEHTIDPQLNAELDVIKSDGFRVAPSGQLTGVTDISVPVTCMDDTAIAVLSCPYISRVQDSDKAPDIESVRELLIALGARLSLQ